MSRGGHGPVHAFRAFIGAIDLTGILFLLCALTFTLLCILIGSPLILFIDGTSIGFMGLVPILLLCVTHSRTNIRSTVGLIRFWFFKPTLEDWDERRFEVAGIVAESAKRLTVLAAMLATMIGVIQTLHAHESWRLLSAVVIIPIFYALLLNTFLWTPLSRFSEEALRVGADWPARGAIRAPCPELSPRQKRQRAWKRFFVLLGSFSVGLSISLLTVRFADRNSTTVSLSDAEFVEMMEFNCDQAENDNYGWACFMVAEGLVSSEAAAADSARVRTLYRKACDAGFGQGCFKLAWPVDPSLPGWNINEVLALYEEACDGEYAIGCHFAGELYSDGEHVAPDPGKAAALYARGCELEMPRSCGNLATMYAEGTGVDKNEAEATRLIARECTLCSGRGESHIHQPDLNGPGYLHQMDCGEE